MEKNVHTKRAKERFIIQVTSESGSIGCSALASHSLACSTHFCNAFLWDRLELTGRETKKLPSEAIKSKSVSFRRSPAASSSVMQSYVRQQFLSCVLVSRLSRAKNSVFTSKTVPKYSRLSRSETAESEVGVPDFSSASAVDAASLGISAAAATESNELDFLADGLKERLLELLELVDAGEDGGFGAQGFLLLFVEESSICAMRLSFLRSARRRLLTRLRTGPSVAVSEESDSAGAGVTAAIFDS
ncbi:presequence protease 2 [Striga asiatica]|uniref:Presequence protease 2 n=1 Tax=Striga asiatica TaxID=4170 RepID=A0A5A7RFI7_STRAF|nr:presequence protease 2 [Striga asiatica]